MRNVSKYLTAPEAFVRRTLQRHTVTDSGCWLYAGSTTRDGYAQANYKGADGKQFAVYVHVLAYQDANGDLTDGMEVDHVCHDSEMCQETTACPHRRCIRPDHLAQVTGQANRDRTTAPPSLNRRKTHCPSGHPYDTVERAGNRRCSTCRTEDKRRDYERNGVRANARRVEKMRTDPEYRERRLAAQRARAASEAGKAARRNRYANDPEYREKIKARVAERYRRQQKAG